MFCSIDQEQINRSNNISRYSLINRKEERRKKNRNFIHSLLECRVENKTDTY
jgi:hypothetical protein